MLRNKFMLSFAFIFSALFLSGQTTSASTTTYTMKANEEIDEIADRFNVTVEDILQLNGLNEEEDATEGYQLKIPAPIEKKAEVQKVETLADYTVVKTLNVEASAYTAYCKGCSGKSAYGIDLRKNLDKKIIAVDPKVIPLGTKVWVEGYGIAIAGDTGGSIKGNRIDIFVKTKKIAYSWGRKKVEIKILK